jgi:hypothetical protein
MADGNKGNSAGHSYGRDSPHAQPHTGASSRPVLEQDAIGDDRLPGNDADIHAGKGPRPRPRPRLESLPCLVASFRRDSPAPIRASAPPLRAPALGHRLAGLLEVLGLQAADLLFQGHPEALLGAVVPRRVDRGPRSKGGRSAQHARSVAGSERLPQPSTWCTRGRGHKVSIQRLSARAIKALAVPKDVRS